MIVSSGPPWFVLRTRAHLASAFALLIAGQAGCADDDAAAAVVGDASANPPDGSALATVLDAGATDAVDAEPVDAPYGRDAGSNTEGCQLGAAGSFATDQQLDLFGDVIYFAQGQELPPGRYRATYEDGCMKYNAIFQWTVNASASDGWWLVGDSSSDRVTVLPGTFPAVVFDGYASFAECVAANAALPPKEFEFGGGKLGIWLNDNPYLDNQAGEGGRNPKWSLTLLVDECPPDLVLL